MLGSSFSLLFALLACFVGSSVSFGQSRPNILWISAEDLSPDLACYGDDYSVTPNLDRLASQGAVFTRAFSAAPVCSPSRSSIITGVYASTIGTHHHRSKVTPPAHVRCFTEYLREAGYFCTNNVKTDYNFPVPPGAWDENSRTAHWKHRKSDQPFFAVFNFTTTHEGQHFGDKPVEGLSDAERHDPAKATLPPYYPDTPVMRKNWAHYYDSITLMDKQIQALLDELDQAGLAEETIVLFWGDHGRGLPRGKRWLYDSGTRVPLIVRCPGKIASGAVRRDLVSLVDLAPTMLSLAGITPPKHMQGRIVIGKAVQPEPPYLFGIRDRMDETHDMMRSVRDERFKYIRSFHPEKPYAQPIRYMDRSPIMQDWRRLDAEGKLVGPQALFFAKTKPPEEFYDTQADPHEVINLAAAPEHRHKLEEMRRELDEWMKRTNDQGLQREAAGNRPSPRTSPE